MAFMTALETDLRALSAEARRRYPAVKDGAEHAILKLRTCSCPGEIVHNEEILRIFLAACAIRVARLSVIGLSSLQKLISHDAVASSSLNEILSTLKDHGEMTDETVQLKTLQTILIIFQSHLHPTNEEAMFQALCICLRLLESSRSSDSVRSTAAATFRQAIALIFDHVVHAESLPVTKMGLGGYISRSSSITGDVNRSINQAELLSEEIISGGLPASREIITDSGKLGLYVLEDLTSLAAGGSAIRFRGNTLQRIYAIEILEFILSNYVVIFKTLGPYRQVLKHQMCSFFMTSLRTNLEVEGETGEPSFKRLVLRSVAHIIRHYSSSLITEVEVFLSMLVKITFLELPLWHRILVLEILRGFCVEARTLRTLFENFDMDAKNTNVVEGMVKALARVVSNVQVQETSEETLAAVAGMFSSKAKGVEWILENDASNPTVLVASEAHATTLAIEGLLGVIFTVATLTDEAMDTGELESPRYEYDPSTKLTGKTAILCHGIVESLWLTILDALSFIFSRSQGEAIVLEILKGYQAFTQACGVLHAVEPLNSFLASLCKFTINFPGEGEKRSVAESPTSQRSDFSVDSKDCFVLTAKNVQALRTLFNVAHRLHNVLGASWVLVLETLAGLDRAIHSPHASMQEVSAAVSKLTMESAGQNSDFHILSSLNSQLFESSGLMHLSSVKSLLSALHQLSFQCIPGASGGYGPLVSQKIGYINFSVERMVSILVNNLHRVQPLWDYVVGHFLELADNSNQSLRILGLNALDQSICAVLGSQKFQDFVAFRLNEDFDYMDCVDEAQKSLECSVISPLKVLSCSKQNMDVRTGMLKILLHVLERHGEKLYYSWPDILEILRSVAEASEKELVTLGFQCLRTIMNDGLTFIAANCLPVCVDVTGTYSVQKTELNISLTAVGLLWTMADFVAKRFMGTVNSHSTLELGNGDIIEDHARLILNQETSISGHSSALLFSIFSLLLALGADERLEVRNAAVRTYFQTLGSHGQKLTQDMWEDCLNNYVFPALHRASHMAATSSNDEWQGKELGTLGGKAVHMLIHHSRNTAQKQWGETLVLVLGGISRLFRSFFPLICSLSCFSSGWESLLVLGKTSILRDNQEVAIAAFSCLRTAVICPTLKEETSKHYLHSVLDVYEHVFLNSPRNNKRAKVKQEILHGLGELYIHLQRVFSVQMYNQLLRIIHAVIREEFLHFESFENEFGHIPPVLRIVLEVLPLMRPPEHLSAMWVVLFRELLFYLPSPESLSNEHAQATQANVIYSLGDSYNNIASNGKTSKVSEIPVSQRTSVSSATSMVSAIQSNLFREKMLSIVMELFLRAPIVEKHIICPEILQSIGRCMTTRRDYPDASLWRVAVKGFNSALDDAVCKVSWKVNVDSILRKPERMSFWKEVADVYEIFLIGHCGRPLPAHCLSNETLKADEALEMATLNVLGDNLLKAVTDAPPQILHRFISTIDICASRTCSLPVHTVELMPLHCGRFSLACLQKLFSLSSLDVESGDWSSTRLEVSKIAVVVLMARCQNILDRFLLDEQSLGDRQLPTTRLEEVFYVLRELAKLQVHPSTASALALPPPLGSETSGKRPHLFVLFPSFCELVMAREDRVKELIQALLRLIARELTLEKINVAT